MRPTNMVELDERRLAQAKNYLDRHLMAMLGNQDLVDKWWTTPNKGFDMQCPRDVDIRDAAKYILGFAYGSGGS